MWNKEKVLKNYKKLETSIDTRFMSRLVDFLTAEEVESLGFELKEAKDDWKVEKEWTEENIIKQLIKDAEFGKEKAEDERGISSALMTEVCEAWLLILEDDSIVSNDWGYNLVFFEDILEKYNNNSKKIDCGSNDELQIMLSNPMAGKSETEINSEREEMVDLLLNYYGRDVCVVRATVIKDHENKSDLECFSESVWHMSQVDILAMGFGWETARGCRLEHEIAKAYDLPIVYLDNIKMEIEGVE